MTNEKYIPLGEHTEKIGKVTFMVSSYANKKSESKPEQLIIKLLENKVLNNEFMEETA